MHFGKKKSIDTKLRNSLRDQIRVYFKSGWKIKRVCPRNFYLINPLGEKFDSSNLKCFEEIDVFSQYQDVQEEYLSQGRDLLGLMLKYVDTIGSSKINFL